MTEMIETRRNAAETRQDLFSNLLKAREEEKDGSTVFSDEDLMGEHRLASAIRLAGMTQLSSTI
jgi:cytochrome P450